MELVEIVEIELPRPRSACAGAFFQPSEPRNGTFVVANSSPDTLIEAIILFAEQCGVARTQLISLKVVPRYNYTPEPDVTIFDIDTPSVQYSTCYAACRTYAALRVNGRYFRLSEISNVSEYSEQ